MCVRCQALVRPSEPIGRWQSCGGFLVSQSPAEPSPATASSTLGVLVPTQGAPRPLLERTLCWSELRAALKRAQSFGFPEPGPPLELATLSTTLALVSTSGWHQLVPNLAREERVECSSPPR